MPGEVIHMVLLERRRAKDVFVMEVNAYLGDRIEVDDESENPNVFQKIHLQPKRTTVRPPYLIPLSSKAIQNSHQDLVFWISSMVHMKV